MSTLIKTVVFVGVVAAVGVNIVAARLGKSAPPPPPAVSGARLIPVPPGR